MFDARYVAQARLLLHCLPELEQHPCFAIKGGTALNLFVRDLPRISVDIDLTYLPLKPRAEALAEIGDHLSALGRDIEARIPGARIHEQRKADQVVRITVTTPEATIKIEPNTVLRGSVYAPETRTLSAEAQRLFEVFTRVRCLSEADLYGGKLCATLDRQHPRDLYDVKLLLDSGPIAPEVRRAFVAYLAGHNRPMSELLHPHLQDIRALYEAQFVGMTTDPVTLDDLLIVQRTLPSKLVSSLDEDERAFLLSMKRGQPEWDLLGFDHLDQLPALQWKLRNIRKMSTEKHRHAVAQLARILDESGPQKS